MANNSRQTRASSVRSAIFEAAVTPFPVPSATGLAKSGKGSATAATSSGVSTTAKSGRRDAEVADHPLRHSLVQGERKHQRIGKGVGDLPGVQEGRDLRLAAETPKPLGDIEDEIPAVARDEAPGQRPDVADPVRLVTERLQGILDRGDRPRMVELRRLFLRVAFGDVIIPEVVCDADLHVVLMVSDR